MAAALLLRHQRRSQRPNNPLVWSILHRTQLRPGTPFNLKQHPYLIALYQESAAQVVVYKASQLGVSEYCVSYAAHACDQRQATVLYVFPTDAHVSDFSSARFGPAIEASSYLSGIVVEGAQAGGKRGADRITLKRIRDRFLYFRGARVTPEGKAPQLKSIDADIIILDELDEMDPRAPAIARKRLGHSSIAEERLVSTPTYPGRGIHAEWLESDQRLWHVRCEGCGERQPLTINSVVTEFDQLGRPRQWHGGPDDAWCACHKCGRWLNRLSEGEWVATYPSRSKVGYHLTRLFSHQADLLQIIQALQTTDETKRRETYNQDLGEPYTPKGSQLSDEVLDRCRRDYAHGPAVDQRLVMGVDVGKVLHGTIRTMPDSRGESRQCWAGELDSWDELGRMMKRFNVSCAVIDALPETTKAREFQAQWRPGVVWLAYYPNQKIGSKRVDPYVWDVENGVVNIDRTRTIDDLLSRFYDELSTLPANARDIRDYYEHLKSLVRILENGPGGQLIARYVESGADHLAHAENYCHMAMAAPRSAATGRSVRSRSVSVKL